MVSPGRVAFTLFGIDIMWYGVLIGSAFLLALLISYYRAPKLGVTPDHVLNITLFLIPSAIIGARAYYVIFSWDNYRNNLGEIFAFRDGGLAIHGGIIMCLIVIYFVCRHQKDNFLDVADLIIPTVALGQAIGRWGNFFNEECHGRPTDASWAVMINGQGYEPTFLYESLWCFLLFAFLVWFTKRRTFRGQILCLYAILYSVERFFVEGLRTDSLMIGPFRQAQVLSVATIVLGILLYIYWNKKHKGELNQ